MKKLNVKTKQKTNKGITLIALVITIIILLILAAVSIATLTGDNGILTKANNAKTTNDKAQAEEEMKLVVADWQLEKKANSSADLVDFLNEKLENGELDGVTDNGNGSYTIQRNGYEATISDEDGLGDIAKVVPPKEITFKNVNPEETNPAGSIPKGATVVEENGEELNDVDKGIVIRDTNNNEWVWIEVPKSQMPSNLKFTNEIGYSEEDRTKCDTITESLKTYAVPYTEGKIGQNCIWKDEWYADRSKNDIVTEITANSDEQELDTGCGLTLSEYKETYQKMIKSVYKNGGFWIGRYEAGIEGTTETDLSNARTTHTDITDGSPKAISQKDAIPYNYVYCSEAQKLASKMTPDSNKTSSLLFGIQWDLVCKFIEEKEVKKQGDSQKATIIASINSNSETWGNYNDISLPITSQNAKGYSTNNKVWSQISENKLSYDNNSDNILLSVGASNNTEKLNIYDFAGNEFEWTLEHAATSTNYPCSSRGGCFYHKSSKIPASNRDGNESTSAGDGRSFRPALY